MKSYRDTWEYRLYEALAAVMEGTSNDDGIPCKDKEHAEKIMDEWASEQLRKNEKETRLVGFYGTYPNKDLNKKD